MGTRALAALAALAATICLAAPAPASAATVVSIGFDDGWASQAAGAQILDQHGLKATFFVNTGRLGTADHLTWDDLHRLAAEGHEIAGHTVLHQDLTTLHGEELHAAVCDDRASLLANGFPAYSFAYPFGRSTDEAAAVVQACGYESGRISGGVEDARGCSGLCPPAETTPPEDRYRTRTFASVTRELTVADLEAVVTRAEARGGGWLQLVFHAFDEENDAYAWPSDAFATFIGWLAARAALGTVTLTTHAALHRPQQTPYRQRLLPGSLRVPFTCLSRCTVRVSASAVGPDARLLGVRSGTVVARADASRSQAGSYRVTLRPGPALRRALARRVPVSVTVAVRVTSAVLRAERGIRSGP